MHETLEPLAALVGTWRGTGTASYPTINDFSYTEEFVVTDIGKPFLVYSQRTWAANGRPSHTEQGYFRATNDNGFELVAAIPTGQSESGVGTFTLSEDGLYITSDAQVMCTPTAKRVDRIVRSFHCAADRLVYDMAMAAVGVGMTAHLHGELVRA